MYVTYRYRLLPSRRQHRALEAILESQRELYNAALQERNDAYRSARITRTYYDQTRALTEWRESDPDARAFPVLMQRATLKRVDHAYRQFFRRWQSGRRGGKPRYQGKGRFHSFRFHAFLGIRLVEGGLEFKCMPGRLRVHFHRPMPDAPIRSCTFRRDAALWHVGFTIEVPEPRLKRDGNAVGIDLGLTDFAVLSDGNKIPSLRAARRAQRRMRVAQRSTCRKKVGSNSWKKAKAAVRRCHSDIRRARRNHLHLGSRMLVDNYRVIAVERLNIAPMAKSTFSRDVGDAAWATFISMLRYKAAWAGARLIEVDCRETSQECSGCGTCIAKGIGERYHRCESCGIVLSRDLNAARTILNRAGVGPGLRNVVDKDMRAGGSAGFG